jgi:hypothetical protein
MKRPGVIALAALVVALGCRTAAPVTRAVRPTESAPHADAWPTPTRDDSPGWELVTPAALPTPVRDIGALAGGEAILAAGAGLYRWRENQPEVAVCEMSTADVEPGAGPAMVQAEGDRFVALNQSPGAPVLWVSENRGESCRRVELAPFPTPTRGPGRMGLNLSGRTLIVWSNAGSALRSLDAGAVWEHLPDLDGGVEFAPGPGDSVFAAARVDARSRVQLYRWTPAAREWEPVRGGEDRRLPVTFQTVDARTVIAADAHGTLTLDGEGAVRTQRLEPLWRGGWDEPRVIAVASGGRFLASTSRLLVEVTATGARPFAALPELRDVHAIDASVDGYVWATDARSVWRGRFDSPLAEVTRRPLPHGSPSALAARGRDLAMASESGVIAWSRDGGAHWRRMSLPPASAVTVGVNTRPLAMHFDARGTLFVMYPHAVAVSDGGEFEVIALPRHAQVQNLGAFTTIGDRWVVAQGDVLTSDDRGERWVHRFGPGDLVPTAVAMGLAGPPRTPVPVAYALGEGAVGYLLDSERNLWRTDDGASTFERVEPITADRGTSFGGWASGALLAWDGRDRVAVFANGMYSVSRDGGVHFHESAAGFRARFATSLDDATLVMSAPMSLSSRCPSGNAFTALLETHIGWLGDPDVCAHEGSLFARDGDLLYTLSADGTLWRVGLRHLARRIVGAARPPRPLSPSPVD